LFLSGTRILVRWHCLRQSSEFELVVFLVLLVLLAINVILMPAVAGA
jgi:hypothetical protein